MSPRTYGAPDSSTGTIVGKGWWCREQSAKDSQRPCVGPRANPSLEAFASGVLTRTCRRPWHKCDPPLLLRTAENNGFSHARRLQVVTWFWWSPALFAQDDTKYIPTRRRNLTYCVFLPRSISTTPCILSCRMHWTSRRHNPRYQQPGEDHVE